MLIINGTRESSIPMTFMGDALHGATQTRWLRPQDQLAIFCGEGGFLDKTAMPEGAYPPNCWKMPLVAGSLSSHQKTICTATAALTLVSGRAISGLSAGSVVCAATGGLIVSSGGAAAGVATVSGTVIAVLVMSGSASGSATVEGAIGALAWCSGLAEGSAEASLGSYAIGYMSGAVYVNEGTASIEQLAAGVWDALTAEFTGSGTMGEAMAAAGSAGDPWIAELPGSYTGQQAGNIIGKKLLTTAKFLGLK